MSEAWGVVVTNLKSINLEKSLYHYYNYYIHYYIHYCQRKYESIHFRQAPVCATE